MSLPERPAVGDLVDVEIEKLVAGGEGLGRVDGFVIFARPAYPGDVVRVSISESRRSFARGMVVERLAESPLRKESPCPIAERCGGCDWTSYRLDAQLRAKRDILTESLTRIGRIEENQIPPITIHSSPLDYRLRSRLHFDDDGRPGFFAFRTHEVVPLVPECEVIGPRLRDQLSRGEISGEPGTDAVFLENESELITGDPSSSASTSLAFEIRGFRYDVGLDTFFQVNRHLLGTLIDLMIAHADRVTSHERALDLYGGSGFFALALASRFDSVVSVESDERAHRLAARHDFEAVQSDVAAFLENETSRPDFIALDPPRSGTHPKAIEAIDRLDPEVVSYLSCDPVHLSRDLGRFLKQGWRLETIDLIDLFPNTHHVETLVSLARP